VTLYTDSGILVMTDKSAIDILDKEKMMWHDLQVREIGVTDT